MYRSYYKLTHKPFELAPNPNMVYLSEQHQEALAIFRYGVIENKDFLLLSGDVGTGKSTIIQLFIKTADPKHLICLLDNPTMGKDDFYYFLASHFNLPQCQGNKAKFLISLTEFLKVAKKKNRRAIIIIDEAHTLSLEVLEEIRLLSNQSEAQSVLGIFLVGQPEINDLLHHDQLLPLRQRISIRFNLQPFPEKETGYYIKQRLLKAGGQVLDIFTTEAITAIHKASGGTPRIINTICDQAMIAGYSAAQAQIDKKAIHNCLTDMEIPRTYKTKKKKGSNRLLRAVKKIFS